MSCQDQSSLACARVLWGLTALTRAKVAGQMSVWSLSCMASSRVLWPHFSKGLVAHSLLRIFSFLDDVSFTFHSCPFHFCWLPFLLESSFSVLFSHQSLPLSSYDFNHHFYTDDATNQLTSLSYTLAAVYDCFLESISHILQTKHVQNSLFPLTPNSSVLPYYLPRTVIGTVHT